jgi:hypothetical protein
MSMFPLLVILLALLALLAALWWLPGKAETKPALPFNRRPSLLTPAEQVRDLIKQSREACDRGRPRFSVLGSSAPPGIEKGVAA